MSARTAAASDLAVYMEILATPGTTREAMTAVEDLIAAHPSAHARVAGIRSTARHTVITVAATVPARFVADRRFAEARAAYAFACAVLARLSRYMPRYAAEPSPEAQAVARKYLAHRH